MMPEPPQTPGSTTCVAAIDIGSSAIRMAVAEIDAEGRIKVLERTQRAVRFGHDTFVTGRLSNQAIAAAISILKDYRKLLEMYQVKDLRAVATTAVREASNSDAFLDRVYLSCGFDVEIIGRPEESHLIVSAVRHMMGQTFGYEPQDTLIVEVGSGSALLTLLHNGEIEASENYRLGSIRLQELLSTANMKPNKAAELIRHQIAGILSVIPSSMNLKKVRNFIAVGGDARLAAREIGTEDPRDSLEHIDLKDFDRFVTRCESKAPQELVKLYDLPYADAETLVPALIVYQALAHVCACKQIVVCHATMRDGLLLDLARRVMGRDDPQFETNVIQSAHALGEKYHYNFDHAHHVAELSIRLFDELQALHGLSSRHRLLLRVAALLHEIGGFVGDRAHHKHSYYLLSNSEIFGLRREELQCVALLARYHRRSCPKNTHLEYTVLPRDERAVVSKLAALLRVADALDRGHGQQVSDLDLERTEDELIIRVHGVTDLTLERRAVSRKGDLFEEVYGIKTRLEESPGRLQRRSRAARFGNKSS